MNAYILLAIKGFHILSHTIDKKIKKYNDFIRDTYG